MGFVKKVLGGGSGGTSSNSTQKVDMTTKTTETTNPFTSDSSKANYGAFHNAARDNFGNISRSIGDATNNLNNVLSSYKDKGIGDTSYFKQAWGQAQGIDNSNLRSLNSQSLDPYDSPIWNNWSNMYDKTFDAGYGRNLDQANQNIIGSGMRNGSGHQTALAKVAAQSANERGLNKANTYLSFYNQNKQDALAANKQLQDFYTTLSNIGIDYAKLTQQDLATLLSAYETQRNMYGAQNDALRNWGNAVQMGSDPTTTNTQTQKGTTVTNGVSGKKDGTWGNVLGTTLGLARGFGLFGQK